MAEQQNSDSGSGDERLRDDKHAFVREKNSEYTIAYRQTQNVELTDREARKEIVAALAERNVMVNSAKISNEELKELFPSLPSFFTQAAFHSGLVWVYAYFDGTNKTGEIKFGASVVFDSVTGKCVTGINEAWGTDEYKIVGTAWKEHNTPGYGRIPVTINSQATPQKFSLVIGVSIESDSTTTATVESRPPGIIKVPGENESGEVQFENPAEFDIPEDGGKGYLAYEKRGGSQAWELISIKPESADDETPPQPGVPSFKIYEGITSGSTLHALGAVQSVSVSVGGVLLPLDCDNITFSLPPGILVTVAWVDTRWAIVAAHVQAFLVTPVASAGYAQGDTGEFVFDVDPTTPIFPVVSISGVICLTRIPPASGDAKALMWWNGFVWLAKAITNPFLMIDFEIYEVGPPILGTVTSRPDTHSEVPGEVTGRVELHNGKGYEIVAAMKGSAWYRGGAWSIIDITHECEEEVP